MAGNRDVKPHIYLGANGAAAKYTYPGTVVANHNVPEKNRQEHYAHLKNQLDQLTQNQQAIATESQAYELESRLGIQVAFDSFPGVDMAVASLADAVQGIELLNVQHTEDQVLATIFVPQGKLATIEKKLQSYIDYKKDINKKPRDNRKLIDAIQNLRAAALDSLWTDDADQLPVGNTEVFQWEVWLPVMDDREAIIHDFKILANAAGIEVSDSVLEFPERSILLVVASRDQFESSTLLLSKVSELRRAKETAAFFDELPPLEQAAWSENLLSRLRVNNETATYITILDSGSNIGHPLLAPFISPDDQFTVDANWSPTDDNGHGTGMAGLAIWGDLTEPLASSQQVQINHRLESVKLIRTSGDNEGRHHGIITANGISEAEIANPNRTRVFAMALSSTDGRDRGKPSAWSSTIDSLAVDYLGEGQSPRFIAICAGNTGQDLRALLNYPDYNQVQDIHDPGQSWNALTVGAFTQKSIITEPGGYAPLAPSDGLSPYSTTSVSWEKSTPIKPEVVFEGGNVATDGHNPIGLPSLKLLTTHDNINERHFSTTEATSAATALASKFAAEIYTQYPTLRPETVRALLVHSAQWTPAMQEQFTHGTTDRQKAHHLMRCVGYGVPSLEKALWSASNSLVMIVEDEVQPYEKRQGKQPSSKDMNLHDLPWPIESLQALGEVEVEMTVTLSYFIEPNPSSRNVSGKYNYPSHQLRFDVKRPTESPAEFQQRISRHGRNEEEGTVSSPSDPNWLLGEFRNKGSIHKDVWKGSAVDLAARGQIAIYPALGWWRNRTKLACWNKKAKYSLVVSIAVPEVDIDLYTEITNKIEADVGVAIEISST